MTDFVKRTFNSDNTTTVNASSALSLLKELHSQIQQGNFYVSNSFVQKNSFNPFFKVTVGQQDTLPEPTIKVSETELKDGSSVITSPHAESILCELNKLFKDQPNVLLEKSTLISGCYCVYARGLDITVNDEVSEESEENLVPLFKTLAKPEKKVSEFDMSIALSKESKDELVEYVTQYGINLDKRRNLTAMQNELKTIVNTDEEV